MISAAKDRHGKFFLRRFWSKVGVTVGQNGKCWEWKGSRNKSGHGRFGVNGYTEYSHRMTWILTKGPIPAGMCVCHSCDNPGCCNPSHLWLGTHTDNMRDMVIKKRYCFGEKHRNECRKRAARGSRSGAKRYPEKYRGESNSQSKLTAAQVAEIRAIYSGPERPTQRAIASCYGLSPGQVGSIVRGVSWK